MSDGLDLLGKTVGNIRIVELLAQGGMGAVYVGVDERLNRRVAVKAVHERFRVDPQAREDFLREARVLSRLQHPNICQIFELVEDDKNDYLVLELIFGKTLEEKLDQGIEAAERPRVSLQMAEALVAAHGKGIVHWDLKPANVMLTEDHQVKVLDFGLARSLDDEQMTRVLPTSEEETYDSGTISPMRVAPTRNRQVVGTPGYMSPEQVRGDRATTASDMFSFGLVLQELFTGRSAFDRGMSSKEILRRTAEGETAPVEGIDADLARLIERLKSHTPGPRPSAVDVLERLRWIFDKPVRATKRRLQIGAVLALVLVSIVTSALWIRGEKEAERARAARDQADALVGFMLEDLHNGLEPLGRLDLLDKVAQRALGYYEASPENSLELDRRHEHRVALRNVGQVLLVQGNLTDARAAYSRALELGDSLGTEDPRWKHERSVGLGELGKVMRLQGEIDEAMVALRRALELEQELVDEDRLEPDWQDGLANLQTQLGVAYEQQGRFDEAREAFAKSLAIRERLVLLDPENDSWRYSLSADHRNVGDLMMQSRDLDGAMTSFGEALRIRKELVEEDPANAWWLNNLAVIYGSIGDLHFLSGEIAEAGDAYGEARAIRRRLVTQDPTNTDWRDYFSGDSGRLGDVLTQQGLHGEAREAYRESLSIRLRLVAQDPTNAGWQNNLAFDYRSLGDLARLRSLPEEALEMYLEALEIDRSQAEVHPQNDWWKNSMAFDLISIGKAERDHGRGEQALEAWTEAAAIMKPVTPSSSNLGFLDTHVVALLLLGRSDDAAPIVERLQANDWQESEFLELSRAAGFTSDEP